MIVTQETAQQLAQQWLTGWNERVMDALIDLYGSEILYLTPLANIVIDNKKDGLVSGKSKIRDYFSRCIDRWPDQQFKIQHLFIGVESLTVLYSGFDGAILNEIMILNPQEKIKKVYCNYMVSPTTWS